MNYVEYIQNSTATTKSNTNVWGIPLGYTPSVNNNVRMRIKFNWSSSQYDGNFLAGAYGTNDMGLYFRLFTYQANKFTFDCPNDGRGRITITITGSTSGQDTELETGFNNGVLYITDLNNQSNTVTASTGEVANFTEPWAVWKGMQVAQGTKIYYIEAYEGNTKVKDWRPAIDNNGIPCLYETIGGTYHYNQYQAGTLVVGAVLTSIVVEPTQKSVAYEGGSFSASVQTENSWTASAADGTWLTLDVESGTGDTVVTITVDQNDTGSARTDVVTFVDMNTSDEAVLTIRQKKYVDGQPMYIGDAEITEFYLGSDTITEMYLGDVLVYSAFSGGDDTPEYCNYESEDYNPDACSCIQGGYEWIDDGEGGYCDDGRMPGECDSPECEECVQNGGEWVVPEIGDPYCQYAPDYCDSESEDYNEDACNCISAGGVWEYDSLSDHNECHCNEDPECECMVNGGIWDGENCQYPGI